jgi:hypothetical protein
MIALVRLAQALVLGTTPRLGAYTHPKRREEGSYRR